MDKSHPCVLDLALVRLATKVGHNLDDRRPAYAVETGLCHLRPLSDQQPVFAPQFMVAHSSISVKTLQELVAVARARPAQLSRASFGIGGITRLVTEMVVHRFGIRTTHVPFTGPTLAVYGQTGSAFLPTAPNFRTPDMGGINE